ncbi:hypothetical protein OPIT5_05235 [Opitutaceae bacterium TAV5]|nr:hypothetical protein OPIT5_05235 [Opitutaceae bacterium TAV5]
MTIVSIQYKNISPARGLRRWLAQAGLALSVAIAPVLHGQTAATGFESDTLAPFGVEVSAGNLSEIIEPSGFAPRAGSKVHHLRWCQSNYTGSRTSRGVEGTSGSGNPRITEEGWFAFSFLLPDTFPAKSVILGQLICWMRELPKTNKTVALSLNANGRLTLDGYSGDGTGGATREAVRPLLSSVKRGVWHDFVIYVRFSNKNTGVMKAWIDGAPEAAPTVEVSGINLGNGAFDDTGRMTDGAYVKWGMYCHDVANHTEGETRDAYFDEVAYLVGNPPGAFDLVRPKDPDAVRAGIPESRSSD